MQKKIREEVYSNHPLIIQRKSCFSPGIIDRSHDEEINKDCFRICSAKRYRYCKKRNSCNELEPRTANSLNSVLGRRLGRAFCSTTRQEDRRLKRYNADNFKRCRKLTLTIQEAK